MNITIKRLGIPNDEFTNRRKVKGAMDYLNSICDLTFEEQQDYKNRLKKGDGFTIICKENRSVIVRVIK